MLCVKESYLKEAIKRFCFPPSSVRRIRVGPLKGRVFRVSDVTGMSPWYSGAEREHQRTFKNLIDIERYHPYFVIDLHTPEQDVSVASLLTPAGYRLSRLSGPPIQRTDTGWPDPDGVWGSILATPAL